MNLWQIITAMETFSFPTTNLLLQNPVGEQTFSSSLSSRSGFSLQIWDIFLDLPHTSKREIGCSAMLKRDAGL